MHTRLLWLVIVPVVLLFAHPVVAQGDTGVRLVVWDAQNQPIAGLSLTVATDGAAPLTLHTDAQGVATASGLNGQFFRITTVQQADGTRVPIDATTLDEGLRLGLVPQQQRTVLLRIDSNLLFVDPETLFAGTDSPPTLATAAAQATEVAATAVSIASGGTGADMSGAAPTTSSTASSWSRWHVGLLMALVVLVPVLVMSIRTVVQARRQARRAR